MLPTLQRLFLSNNSLEKFEDAGCVFKIKFLLELALDGNPMVEKLEQAYAADPGIIVSRGDNDVGTTGEGEEKPGSELGLGSGSGSRAGPGTPVSKGRAGKEDKGNIFVTSSNLYRSFMIENIRTLRHFDLKRVTEEERRQASVLRKRIEDRKKMQHKKNKMNAERKTAIRAAERAWNAQNGQAEGEEEDEDETADLTRRESGGENLGTPNRKMSPITVKGVKKGGKNVIEFTDTGGCEGGPGGTQGNEGERDKGAKYNYNDMLQVQDSPDRMAGFKPDTPGKEGGRLGQNEVGVAGGKIFQGSIATGPREGYRTIYSSLTAGNGNEGKGSGRRNGGSSSGGWKGYYEVEVPLKKDRAGEGKVLFIYGDGTDCFNDNPNVIVDCTEVVFRYIDVDAIVQNAPHIFLGTNAEKLTFSHNSFKAFSQLQKLNVFCVGLGGGTERGGGGDILGGGRRIVEIEISPEGNPCASLSTYREFCAFSMNKLEVLDGVEITRDDREMGRQMFGPLKRLGGDGTRSIAQYIQANLFKTGGRGLGLFNRASSGVRAGAGGGGKGSGGGTGGKNDQAEDLAIARCTEKLVVNMANLAIDTNKNTQAVDEIFPGIISDIVDEAINHRMNEGAYMESCLEMLQV